ncbi:hypothetical protein A2866_03410 [Candidatus Roizmanbacteria bacterium RIFCSPHIGHO2_01_FULL_39_8]|uniref:Glycosyltransferase RgtA/B/C/D-like domain-containing protein n=1 Tax=Candidatus Roizmanbacteria bacterium RIFCSPHIGHO2_01_FULL_39_8 TaxID=1802033 RepID=A0A1F7GSX5_9BACT|nr:MAG: hypothetical protein A2866_03410 [Candidatus Roizmanbacteria bacterium RIFCSPHIGHO2_01_FULL_39_8]
MKHASALFDYFIVALFFTNLWIILYTNLNKYLYFLFPPKITVMFYQAGLGNPEPFEISLYIVLSLLFVGLVRIFYQFHIKSRLIRVLLFIFLSVLFLGKLGNFPLAGQSDPYFLNPDRYLYYIAFILYCITVSCLIIELSLLYRLFSRKRTLQSVVFFIILLVLAFFTFNPFFQISHIDAALFYGPVYEIASGKTIFSQIPSQYGFLSILFFTLFYKFSLIPFAYLPVFIWVCYITVYFICFYLIYRVSKSISFSLIGLFSIVTVNYFSATYGPQASPIRWLPLFLLLMLFYKLKKIDSRIILTVTPFLMFWNIDAGIALIFGYCLTLFLLFLLKQIKTNQLIFSAVFLGMSTLVILGTVQIVHIVLGLQPIDFFKLYYSIKKNAVVGMLMIPIQTQTYFWLFILIYFVSIVYVFMNRLKNQHELLLLSANLSLFASIYFVGRSMPHELITVSLFILFTLFLLIGISYSEIQLPKMRLLILVFMFIFFIIFPAFQRKEFITEKLIDKYKRVLTNNIFLSEIDTTLHEKYKNEVVLIKKSIKENEIVILSPDDTYLFYLVDKKNLLDANPVFGSIDIQSEIGPAIKRVGKVCPAQLVIDCSIVKRCPKYESFSRGSPAVFPYLLEEIEKKCNTSYEPILCSDQLCIVKKTI